MSRSLLTMIEGLPLYRQLSEEDRAELAALSTVETYQRGSSIFAEGGTAEHFYTLVEGRVKLFRSTPDGRNVILEILGAGDPVGAVAVYEEMPYPATAMALEPTTCLRIAKSDFFRLLETRPSLVRGLLVALTRRLMLVTGRLAERTGGRVENRFARLFLKLAEDIGEERGSTVFIPMPLSRQDLADLLGTTVETAIRVMSRWGKDNLVMTVRHGFLVNDVEALESLALH